MKQVNTLISGDHITVLKQFRDHSVDLTVTSPPYDNLRNYDGYQFDYIKLLSQLKRVTKPGGVCVWVVADQVRAHNETGTSFRQALAAKDMGWNLFQTLIYEKSKRPVGSSCTGYFHTHEYMFVFSLGKPKTVNLLRDSPNKNAGKRSTNTTHRTVDGVLEPRQQRMKTKPYSKRGSVWYIPNGYNKTTTYKPAYGHPAIFSEQLAIDHIKTWSNPGDLVLDPMCGSGTTPAMAAALNRKYCGIDMSQKYIGMAEERVRVTLKKVRENTFHKMDTYFGK